MTKTAFNQAWGTNFRMKVHIHLWALRILFVWQLAIAILLSAVFCGHAWRAIVGQMISAPAAAMPLLKDLAHKFGNFWLMALPVYLLWPRAIRGFRKRAEGERAREITEYSKYLTPGETEHMIVLGKPHSCIAGKSDIGKIVKVFCKGR